MITQLELKKRIHYCPKTGVFTRISARFKPELVGSPAGWQYNGYTYMRVDCTAYKAHRLAFLYMTGVMPELDVDHIDGNRSNNAWSNLRLVDDYENSRNQSLYRNNTSGVPGVKLKRRAGRWEVYINNKPRVYIGSSKDWFEAVCMRKSAENKYGYHENHGRAA